MILASVRRLPPRCAAPAATLSLRLPRRRREPRDDSRQKHSRLAGRRPRAARVARCFAHRPEHDSVWNAPGAAPRPGAGRNFRHVRATRRSAGGEGRLQRGHPVHVVDGVDLFGRGGRAILWRANLVPALRDSRSRLHARHAGPRQSGESRCAGVHRGHASPWRPSPRRAFGNVGALRPRAADSAGVRQAGAGPGTWAC